MYESEHVRLPRLPLRFLGGELRPVLCSGRALYIHQEFRGRGMVLDLPCGRHLGHLGPCEARRRVEQ